MPKTISKRIINGTGKHTGPRHSKAAANAKPVRQGFPAKARKNPPAAYSIEEDPMAQVLLASGFREMTEAEYEKVRPYLKPKKVK